MNAARAFLLALLVCWGFAAFADVAVPPLSGRVVDQTGTLSAGDIASLTQTLKALELRKGSQVAVLIVPTTEPETIEQYSIRVAEAWKIGRKKIDDGALLVVAKNDHKLRIEVGYGLEGALNDVTARRIIDEIITPKFRNGDFAGGISAGVDRIIGVIDGEPLPAPAPKAQRQPDSDSALYQFLNPLNPFTIIFILVLGGIFRRVFGRLFGSLASGGLIGLLVWFVFGSLILSGLAGIVASVFTMFSDAITAPSPAGHGRGGGWVGGGSGSSWSGGGSSSDSGGFSGGGGSFGGGGASGSW
ncbi:YgcG family protein [Bradyrhizobium sp.]|uniref:TPM domain-containing protein n=1 Tax=Bradyrhizobium sp. TaxID=376 RepID=UPI0025B84879|nr:YgcG family protein [Bradyrhizobium sp.]